MKWGEFGCYVIISCLFVNRKMHNIHYLPTYIMLTGYGHRDCSLNKDLYGDVFSLKWNNVGVGFDSTLGDTLAFVQKCISI